MNALWLAIALSAAPHTLRLAAPGLAYVNLDSKSGDLYIDYFARKLASEGDISVTTRAEIDTVLGVARQRELAGCGDASCTAELAGALGVHAIITGNFARAAGGYVVSLRVVSSQASAPLVESAARLKDEAALFDWMDATAKTFAAKLLGLPPPSPVEIKAEPAGTRGPAWIGGAIVTALLLGGGGVADGLAQGTHGALETGAITASSRLDVDDVRARGQSEQAVAVSLFAAGALSAVTTAVLFALPVESRVRRWVPAIAGAASLVAGCVLLGLSRGSASQLNSSALTSSADVSDARASGESLQAAGFSLIGTAAVGIVATLLLLLLS